MNGRAPEGPHDAHVDDALRGEPRAVLAAWRVGPEAWRLVGSVPGMRGALARQVVALGGERYVVRLQPPELSEDDTRFRHAFQQHLAEAGVPVPRLLPRPDGTTWAVVGDGIYELQEWREGHPYLSSGPASEARLTAAAATLGQFHQASASFAGEPHHWPEERSPADQLAEAYSELIGAAAGHEGRSIALMAALARLAESCAARIAPAAEALATPPRPPELHLHGDYQPHNLAFGARGVSAIYDLDAARFEPRILELAYSLLAFSGMRWEGREGSTPPLVDEGLDVARAARYLAAYGAEAPPAEGEARLLGDAVALVFPIVVTNGAVEDLIFPEDYAAPPDEADALARLHWAETFWLWLDRYRDALAQAWETGAGG